MTRRSDPHATLIRSLADSARACGLTIQPGDIAERPWSSATFTGCRLTIVLAVTGGDPAAWLATLPEMDFTLPRRLVADLVVIAADAIGATLEVLLLEA